AGVKRLWRRLLVDQQRADPTRIRQLPDQHRLDFGRAERLEYFRAHRVLRSGFDPMDRDQRGWRQVHLRYIGWWLLRHHRQCCDRWRWNRYLGSRTRRTRHVRLGPGAYRSVRGRGARREMDLARLEENVDVRQHVGLFGDVEDLEIA